MQRLSPRAPSVGEIFQLLRAQPMTRAQLCAATGQARSTVTARLDALVGLGLIGQGSAYAPSSMGRPASTFYARCDAHVVLSVDIGASHVRVGVADLNSSILASEDRQISVALGPHVVLGQVIEMGTELLSRFNLEASPLVGVGIGVPGPVNHISGRPSIPPIMPGWDEYDIVGSVHEAFKVPVFVDNDANLMAIGEHVHAWKNIPNLLFVKFATGVGLGIVLDGQIRRGAQGSSGDIGHIRVPGGPPNRCHCGGDGCLESIIGIPALVNKLSEAGLPVGDGTDLVRLVHAGDPLANQLMREAGRTAGLVLAGIVSLLNPSVIAVGGILARAHEQLIAGIREVVYATSLPLATQDLRIVASKAGIQAGIIGASSIVCEEVLSPQAIESQVET